MAGLGRLEQMFGAYYNSYVRDFGVLSFAQGEGVKCQYEGVWINYGTMWI